MVVGSRLPPLSLPPRRLVRWPGGGRGGGAGTWKEEQEQQAPSHLRLLLEEASPARAWGDNCRRRRHRCAPRPLSLPSRRITAATGQSSRRRRWRRWCTDW